MATVALLACLPGIRNQFVQDDAVIISDNRLIHDLGNWREIVTSSYWPAEWEEDLYRPLASLALAVEYGLGGGSPVVFRIVSYLLYAACSIAFLALAWRLFPGPVAVGTALLFAAHPVHVEATALGVGQNEIAVGLLALLMLIRYLDRRRSSTGIVRSGDWILLGALYACAGLLKENALVLPGFLICAEVLLFGGSMRSRGKSLLPGYAFLAFLGIAVLLARFAVLGHLDAPERADALLGLSSGGRALTMLQVVPHWIRLLVWPVHLQAEYSPQEIAASTAFGFQEALGVAGVLLVAAVAWRARKRAPVVSLGVVCAAIAFFPISNLIVPTGVVLAERTLFLPSVGFLLAVGGLVGAVWQRSPKAAYVSLLAVLAILGIVRSAERQGHWRNSDEFLRQSAIDAPRSWKAQGAFAHVLCSGGQTEQGITLYQKAIALAPVQQAWRARNELAECYFGQGEYALAVEQLRQGLAEVPDKRQTWHYLILGYLALGDYPVAARLADSALAMGGSPEQFGVLRAVADSAIREKAPPGSIRIEVRPSQP